MVSDNSDFNEAAKEVLDIITKHRMTFGEARNLLSAVETSLENRAVGSKKA